jgi:Fur family ferric uptake transcriptional regulator
MKKLSSLREELLKVIVTSPRPLRALEVRARMKSRANLSTIYRALGALEKFGTVRSLGLWDGTRCYYEAGRHVHFLLCTSCREIQTFSDCGVDRVQRSIARRFGYDITDHVLYFLGLCGTCARYLKKKSGGDHDR